jgi:phosphoenolpyruvate---glycerone phosphotransferase subunit DhaM
MTEKVGIVIVSHSIDIAKGTYDMASQVAKGGLRIAYCGGAASGGLGTSLPAIQKALDEVWSPAGVVVLVDLGGAEINSELAIEMLPLERREKTLLCNAPIVEGAVMAAT